MIATSSADAVAAEQGGADRLEVVRDLSLGGLTPHDQTVAEIVSRTRLPVRVMLRATPDFAPSQIDRLARSAERFAALGAAGLVLGFLDEAKDVDWPALEQVLAAAPTIPATFHRAFEALARPEAALERLAERPGIDRILVSGDAARLDRLQRLAGERLTILAGGGMDALRARKLLTETAVREIHIGRPARTPSTPDGAVDAAKVRAFRIAAGFRT